MSEQNKKIAIAAFLLLALCFFLVILVKTLFYSSPQENTTSKNSIDQVATPSSDKNPESFMQSIQEKARENQKKYDSSLEDFAEKKWQKILKERNNLDTEYLVDNLKTLDRKVEKDDSGSSVFKIKFRLKKDEENRIFEDYYYLLLSDSARESMNLTNLKANVFLSEEDIVNNIDKEGFARISKIK